MEAQRMSITDLKHRMDTGEHPVIIDSRSADAWAKSDVEIPGAIRVPPDDVEGHLQAIPRNSTVVTYCT